MKHLTFKTFHPEIHPEDFRPILFVSKAGLLKYGSFYAGIFYSNGEKFRVSEVRYWAELPRMIEEPDEV